MYLRREFNKGKEDLMLSQTCLKATNLAYLNSVVFLLWKFTVNKSGQ